MMTKMAELSLKNAEKRVKPLKLVFKTAENVMKHLRSWILIETSSLREI